MTNDMETIEINKKYGSGAYPSDILRHEFDNLTKSSDKWEHYFGIYTHFYHQLKSHQRCDIKSGQVLVEVGVQQGGSLELWGNVWPGQVIGIDVDPECLKLKYDNPSISVELGDQGSPHFWDDFLSRHPRIDFFIDDGGHNMDQQIITFEKVFPKLSVGGIYICEDCHTSYMQYNGGGLNVKGSFISYAKSFIDIIHAGWWEEMNADLEQRKKIGKDLTSVHFYDSIVVFEKFGKAEMKRVTPKGK